MVAIPVCGLAKSSTMVASSCGGIVVMGNGGRYCAIGLKSSQLAGESDSTKDIGGGRGLIGSGVVGKADDGGNGCGYSHSDSSNWGHSHTVSEDREHSYSDSEDLSGS